MVLGAGSQWAVVCALVGFCVDVTVVVLLVLVVVGLVVVIDLVVVVVALVVVVVVVVVGRVDVVVVVAAVGFLTIFFHGFRSMVVSTGPQVQKDR